MIGNLIALLHLLYHRPHRAVAPFNSDLYVTVAAVLPVYLIALLLGGGPILKFMTFPRALRSRQSERIDAIKKLMDRAPELFSEEDFEELDKPIKINGVATGIVYAMGALALVAFAAGEIASLRALDMQRATALAHGVALWCGLAMTVLTFASVAGFAVWEVLSADR